MGMSCIISKKKQDIDGKSLFLYSTAFDAPVIGLPSEHCYNVWYRKYRMVWLPHGKKFNTFSCFDNTGM